MNLNISTKQFLCLLYTHLSNSKLFKITSVAKMYLFTVEGKILLLKTSICLIIIGEICRIHTFWPSEVFL